MATTTTSEFTLSSHDTALSIIPPKHLWARLDHIRSLYDKAYGIWPPHINLLYPFVSPDSLEAACQSVDFALQQAQPQSSLSALELNLNSVGCFQHKHGNSTLFLHDGSPNAIEGVKSLRRTALEGLGSTGQNGGQQQQFNMHLTMGQTEDINSAAHSFLADKISLIPEAQWVVEEVAVLVRREGGMKRWGTISLSTGEISRSSEPEDFYDAKEHAEEEGRTQAGYYFDEELQIWLPSPLSNYDTYDEEEEEEKKTLSIASYNVLAEFTHPQSSSRYPLLCNAILSEKADADVLVLQEVTDHFLSFLLADEGVRDRYPYCSHGPPDQGDVLPLPNFLNIVLLSKVPFEWEHVPFARKHKGALVAQLHGKAKGIVLAAVHLSKGLTDGAVASKKSDLRKLVGYLRERHEGKPWVVAGDFNIATSEDAIKTAVDDKKISEVTVQNLKGLERFLSEEGGLVEADEAKKATWDPEVNERAKEQAESANQVWPQRYDRILVRPEGVLEVRGFNLFGDDKGREGYPSDHWGIRCLLSIKSEEQKIEESLGEVVDERVVPVHLEKAKGPLAQPGAVKNLLTDLEVIPTEEESAKRKEAFDLLKRVLLDTDNATRIQPPVVIVPVGSYALGVWTSTSDIDVCCIGPFSSYTFFALATSRLRKASPQGVKILRRVKANTGLMLEISVHDIRMDLQYCPAGAIAEQGYPQVLRLPPKDPVWSLAAQTLNKLKPLRDVDYLRRSLPDLPSFRLAHRFIKTWARSRGVYSSRFGFLSGIQISILLSRVVKFIAPSSPSVEDILTTFFSHYATFDWAKQMAYDPFFHRNLTFTRSFREPLAILGFSPPVLNTATAATVPSVRTLSREFASAYPSLLSSPSWSSFLSNTGGSRAFLTQFKTCIKLDLQYWGLSLPKGSSYLGWFESRTALILVDLHRRCPNLHARMWPARFVETSDLLEHLDIEGNGQSYRGCYLIGLDKISPDTPKEELKSSLGALQTVLPRFEEQIRNDKKYFNPHNCWFGASLVNSSSLGDLSLDTRDWGLFEQNAGEEDTESDEEEEEELEEEEEFSEENWEEARRKRKQERKDRKAGKKVEEPKVDMRTDKTKKFRTALDVMNRIKWDAGMDSGDFVVGYEDRFLGAQEKELDEWKTEQTDEEFIPQHRILYFKRKSDGRRVWDRKTRWDEVFDRKGSAIGSPDT
ncbi:nuclear poly(A) polymerase 1 [Podospora australis]|uniref:polynucleotide adenylyltransferase n=1 Tax=Podospora australis TaxID=1536484 RepID=A0AAN6X5R9_9PEZI|nr:nuclear poly(A) polymerase 1 [Podospora australis]